MKPQRIQLKRSKGWRMPPNTVKVDRSTRWGNPFVVGDPGVLDRASSIAAYRKRYDGDTTFQEEVRSALRSKNLACWCPQGEPCHAEVLLEYANAGGTGAADDLAKRRTPRSRARSER